MSTVVHTYKRKCISTLYALCGRQVKWRDKVLLGAHLPEAYYRLVSLFNTVLLFLGSESINFLMVIYESCFAFPSLPLCEAFCLKKNI